MLQEILKLASGYIAGFFKRTHKEGYFSCVIAFLLAFLAFLASFSFGLIVLLFAVYCVYFFRDPKRVTSEDDSFLIAPADGTITSISSISAPSELSLDGLQDMQRVSIFLSVFDVHVNRLPCSGVIKKRMYKEGKFLNATLDKSSKDNERNHLVIQSKSGDTIVVTQIAGLIARRIICYKNEGDTAEKGQKYGIIKFGSRVDLYFPSSYKILVKEGQTMVGGETIIATI